MLSHCLWATYLPGGNEQSCVFNLTWCWQVTLGAPHGALLPPIAVHTPVGIEGTGPSNRGPVLSLWLSPVGRAGWWPFRGRWGGEAWQPVLLRVQNEGCVSRFLQGTLAFCVCFLYLGTVVYVCLPVCLTHLWEQLRLTRLFTLKGLICFPMCKSLSFERASLWV